MQIERTIHGYLAEVQRHAQEAVARAFAGPAQANARRSGEAGRPSRARANSRRSGQELELLQARLEERVRAQPGEAMTTFAAQLQVSVSALHRPMAQLKRAGRVRAVGERHLTRYFPAAARASSAS